MIPAPRRAENIAVVAKTFRCRGRGSSAIWTTSPAWSWLVGTTRLIAVIWHSVLGTGIVPSARVRGGSQPATAACCQSPALIMIIVFVAEGGESGPLFLPLSAYWIHPRFQRWGLMAQRPELYPGQGKFECSSQLCYSLIPSLDKLLPFLALSLSLSKMRVLYCDM